MDLNDLSSNWKKLQATLKDDISTTLKRKASAFQPRFNERKRSKVEPGSLRKDSGSCNSQFQKMGDFLSKSATPASLALWAEDNDVAAKDLAAAYGSSSDIPLPGPNYHDVINEGLSTTADAGKYISIDCEMVGVGPAPDNESALARVSIVNYHGQQLYDSFVAPMEPVTDYRTFVSGITPKLLQSARSLEHVQADVSKLLDGKILIGHSVRNDLDALLLGHPKRNIRDTSKHPTYRNYAGGKTPGLKKLAKEILGVDIQGGEHSSIEDARAAMLLFRKEKVAFEQEHQKKWGPIRRLAESAASGKRPEKKRTKTKRKKKTARK